MEYNIWQGFHSKDHKLQPERLAAAQRIIAKENPDILVLIEACYGCKNQTGSQMDYATLFKYPYGFQVGYITFSGALKIGGNCVLSKHEFSANPVSLSNKTAIRATIPLAERVLHLDVVHPSARIPDQEKLEAIKPLLSVINPPYLITGDFNALSPEDTYDKDALERELKDYSVHIDVEEWMKGRLIQGILDLGLKDAFSLSKRQSTVPTKAEHNKNKTGSRIDYFFITPDVRVITAEVIKTPDTEIASDHYPIVGVFQI